MAILGMEILEKRNYLDFFQRQFMVWKENYAEYGVS